MPKIEIDRELWTRARAFREQRYQELFQKKPGAKGFYHARRALLWCLAGLCLANLICSAATMGTINDYSQLPSRIILFLVSLFFFFIAGRSFQGSMCLWLFVLVKFVQGQQYAAMFKLVTDPVYWTEAPAAVAMCCVQMVFLPVLFSTAVYLSLPSSRRHAQEAMEVEKAYVEMIAGAQR